ncbi:sugar ABC transporter substrate-binding protein [Pseudokineococcus basanitobsidens]|uniref:Sugar ABC transporter substrate-binding protein n=1 Tax=Pseudokineococcus basanitobsidens TaxID=1926649 RepID=A0ABU8RLD4_9ACTN
MTARRRAPLALATLTTVALATSACGGAGGGGGGGGGGGEDGDAQSISVIMVNNPQMEDLQQLTADNFTADTGIQVNFTVQPENDVRAQIAQDFAAQAGQYDVATISNYEVPFYATNEWLAPLTQYANDDADFDQSDILQPIADGLTVDGEIYAEPFYGESSFLMYRTDLFDAAGLTMPENPTWQEVADLAAQIDDPSGTRGICLRGLPGWGQVFAPLTTVVNTFGGTWWDENWDAQVNSPEFVEATQFYVDLVQQHGEAGAAQAGFTECLNAMTQGGTAMWYDATSAAGSLEADGSPVAGKIGYAPAPVVETDSSGWLYSWAWGVQAASEKQDAAWEFISWASSQEYEELVGDQLGWSRVPAGKRSSTYENQDYLDVAGPFAEATEQAISSADPNDPGVQPRPAPGIQFVAIPEFADLATGISENISSNIAGQGSVQETLDQGQEQAQAVGDRYKEDG